MSNQRTETMGMDYSHIEYMRNFIYEGVFDVWLLLYNIPCLGLYNKTYL